MHFHALDSYCAGQSFIHRLDARAKLVVALSLILTAALLPDRSWLAFGLLQALLLLATLASRVGFGLVQRRSVVALPFTLAALTVVVTTPGETLLSIPAPGGAWAVSDAGLLRFASIVVRSYLSIQAAVLLAATTQFPALLQAMGAGCPIVALDTVFNRETLGDAGWYFRPDATDLAEKILWLVRNPDQAKAGGDNARARAAWLYTWEDVADRTERLLRAVATGRDE